MGKSNSTRCKKLCIAKGILSKLRHYAPLTVLRSVYYSIVYSHLQYGITSWGNAAAKYLKKIEVQQSYIVKIVTKAPFFKTKVAPIYQQLNFLTLENILKLEVIKFVLNFKTKTIPKCFDQYFQPASHMHNYQTRFVSGNNLAVTKYNKTIILRLIRHAGGKLWNEMPDEIKQSIYLSQSIFLNKVKRYLKGF